nr:hypothetical protein [Aeromicrobium sp.]
MATRARLFALVLTGALTACEPAPRHEEPVTEPRVESSTERVHPTPTPDRSSPSAAGVRSPGAAPVPDALTTLRGNTRNAIAWAPLSDPDHITVEGSVPRSRAWSTSKPLVIAAYLDTVVDGEPDDIPDQERRWIRDALMTSDGDAIAALRDRIDGSPGEAMTRILRSIGDVATTAPDSYEGTMQWTVREQVRFMAALGNGRVVSPRASAFLLQQMQPIPSQRWGLGAIGARAFKPGWVSAQTETRQMGIVGDHAVAIITAGDGPATIQSDGDYAHAWQLDRLARLLAERIGR